MRYCAFHLEGRFASVGRAKFSGVGSGGTASGSDVSRNPSERQAGWPCRAGAVGVELRLILLRRGPQHHNPNWCIEGGKRVIFLDRMLGAATGSSL